jgi:hypothetical protein
MYHNVFRLFKAVIDQFLSNNMFCGLQKLYLTGPFKSTIDVCEILEGGSVLFFTFLKTLESLYFNILNRLHPKFFLKKLKK